MRIQPKRNPNNFTASKYRGYLRYLGVNGVSRQKSAALYHRGEGVAPISKIPPPPPSPSLSSPFFSPNPQRNLTLPAPLAVSSPTLLTLSLYSPTSVIGPDLGQGNFPLSPDSRLKAPQGPRHTTRDKKEPSNSNHDEMTRVLRSPKDATPFRHRLHKHKHGNAEQTSLYYKQTQIQQTHHHLKKHQTRPNAKPHLLQPTNYRNDNASDARSEPWNQ